MINIITKSGGNQFHGSGFYFFRNQRFDAKDYFAVTKPLNHLNQFRRQHRWADQDEPDVLLRDYDKGGSEKTRPFVITVPTLKMRNGDFSELPTPIYDPLTGPGPERRFPATSFRRTAGTPPLRR